MLNFIKRPLKFIFFIDFVIANKQQMVNSSRHFAYFVNSFQFRLCKGIPNKSFLTNDYQAKMIILRNKSKGKKDQRKKHEEYESDDEDEDEFENENTEADESKGVIKTFSVPSKRVDLILKSALSTSRKKIEQAFYQNRIKINGKTLLKKSKNVEVDNDIDLVLGMNNETSNSLKVERVQILNIKFDSDTENYQIKACVNKCLIINNYTHGNSWKPSKEEEEEEE